MDTFVTTPQVDHCVLHFRRRTRDPWRVIFEGTAAACQARADGHARLWKHADYWIQRVTEDASCRSRLLSSSPVGK